MRIQTRTLGCLAGSVLAVVLSSQSVQAQGAAMHWGAMDLETSVNNCLGRAKKAFSDAQLQLSLIHI